MTTISFAYAYFISSFCVLCPQNIQEFDSSLQVMYFTMMHVKAILLLLMYLGFMCRTITTIYVLLCVTFLFNSFYME
jgi:hypothetical protein